MTFTPAGIAWIEGVLKRRGLPLDGKWMKVAKARLEKSRKERSRAERSSGNFVQSMINNDDHAAEKAMEQFYRTGRTKT